jgi:hypothetical protein
VIELNTFQQDSGAATEDPFVYILLLLETIFHIGSRRNTDTMPRRSNMEHKALQFIVNTGDEGVLQSDLWHQLDASSREGSRIAIKLEGKGLIRRERELCSGRWTYRLYPKRKPASIASIIDCPCLTCNESIRCGAHGAISPSKCERLTEWLNDLTRTSSGLQGDS